MTRVSQLIGDVLKIPPAPEPPTGSAGSVRIFRAAPGFFHYRVLGWAVTQAGTLVGLVVGLAFVSQVEFLRLFRAIEILGIGAFVVQLPLTFLVLRLDYELRWYIVTDRSLRIREGILRVREQTMSFANLQNVAIRQGPIQRLFGISNLQVRTAGGGEADNVKESGHSKRANMHLGYFRGVDNPGDIRDTILEELRKLRDSGLGDPDDEQPTSLSPEDPRQDVLNAAKDLRDEVRALSTLTQLTTPGADRGRPP